jgi:cytochrome c oxidase cbb3-type subunit I
MTEAVEHENTKAPLASAAVQLSAELRSAVDAAVRPVVVWLFFTSVCWLLLATGLGALASLKLHFPRLLDYACISYGRLAPAASGAFVFGWCSTAALGVTAWLLPRLSGGVAPGTTVASLGVVLWNAGVLLGVLGNIAGNIRPIEGLEFPFASFILMFGGVGLLAVWILLGLSSAGTAGLAGMFVAGALMWLGWSLSTGNLLIATKSVAGVVEQIVGAWTASGVLWLWLVPVALGAAYYIVPKVTGRPIFAGSTGRALFWLYFLCAGLLGANRLAGGPVPLWIVSVSASASILLLVPVLGAVYNLFATAQGSDHLATSPSLRFVLFGSLLLGVAALVSAFGSLRAISYAVRFTMFESGVQALLLGGGVSMILFGAIYFIMPRLSGCEWLSSTLVSVHFLGGAYGACMGGAMMLLSGLAAGSILNEADSTFSQVIETGSAYYWGNTISYGILWVAYSAFALHFLLVALRIGQPAGEPTLFRVKRGH